MARPIDMIKEIDGTRETLKLAVRVIDIWLVQNQGKGSHLEMVIMDSKGDKIQALVKKDELPTYKPVLNEHNTYMMQNFKVVKNDSQYKVCDHNYKLLFTPATYLKEFNAQDIPPYVFHFKSFSDILSGDYQTDLLVDIIGAVQEVTFQQLTNSPKKVVINLEDLNGTKLCCTLWEKYALKLTTYMQDMHESGSLIILLTQSKIKQAQGVYPLSVSNSFHGSKLFINEDLPEIQAFKKSYDATEFQQNLSQSQNLSQFSATSTLFSEEDRFMYKAQVMSLSEINDLTKETICVTVGTLAKILVSKSGWYYESCNKCNKKAEELGVPFTCKCGKHNEKSVSRYKLEVMVYDKNSNSTFVLWDRDCAELIGMSCVELRSIMAKCDEDDPKLYPKPLDNILGYTLAFRVKVQPGFNNSSVMKFSHDQSLVKTITEQLQRDENVTCEVDKTMSGVNEESHYGTSLSATADHDPNMNVGVTPVKRLSSEIASHVTYFEEQELGSTQLSTTKLKRHVKME